VLYYKSFAVILLNTCILLLFLNIIIFLGFKVKDYFSGAGENNPVSQKYSSSSLREVYPELSDEALNDLLSESWTRPLVYEPFTQLKEKPFHGMYVNVDENGFRITKNQGNWPPESSKYNIFLFGGSTIFGYGVSDSQTIASYLQEALSGKLKHDVRVYNFGRAFYYSSQELIFFENLLLSGFIPDMAIFVDGLNEFFHYNNEPFLTDLIKPIVDGKIRGVDFAPKVYEKLPMIKVFRVFKSFIKKKLNENNETHVSDEVNQSNFNENISDTNSIFINVINTYLQNKKIIESAAGVYGVQPVLVWQPIPTYKYDLNYHLFFGSGISRFRNASYGYRHFEEFIKEKPLSANFFWSADIQEKIKLPLYVDKYHYSPKMSQILANKIAEFLLEKNLIKD
jgi:hypothetical protein